MDTIKLLIGADLVPTIANQKEFDCGNIQCLIGDKLYDLLQTADLRIFNLEVPLTDTSSPIRKCGPNLIAPTSSINGIKKINPSFLTLANNHIMDQGLAGLDSTKRILEKNEILYGGVGSTLDEAEKPWITTIRRITVGIYVCTEHEFSIVNELNPGANPFDPLVSFDQVSDLKEKCDCVIVLYHGGKENYRYPSPNLQKTCRKFVQKGADLVVCQHSHCIGCKEEYKSGTIIYGQGNFLFDKYEYEGWQTSILLDVSVSKDGIEVNYIPLKRTYPGVRIAEGRDGDEILEKFKSRSLEILEPDFIRYSYEELAQISTEALISRIDYLSNTAFFKVGNKLSGGKLRTWYLREILLKKRGMIIQNTIECEAWRELILTCIKKS